MMHHDALAGFCLRSWTRFFIFCFVHFIDCITLCEVDKMDEFVQVGVNSCESR